MIKYVKNKFYDLKAKHKKTSTQTEPKLEDQDELTDNLSIMLRCQKMSEQVNQIDLSLYHDMTMHRLLGKHIIHKTDRNTGTKIIGPYSECTGINEVGL